MRSSTRRLFLTAAAAASAFAFVSGPAEAQPERSYVMGTATTGGTYYPVGVALATLIKVKLQPVDKISISAITSAGSGENIKLMRENQAQFGILQGLYGAWAWTGSGEFQELGPQRDLRSVTMLWRNVEHFTIASEFVRAGDASDLAGLKGRKFSIGQRNSGTEGSGRTILAGLGIDPDSFDLAYLGYSPSADALQNGVISGMNTPAGAPVAAVTQAAAALGDKIRVLDFTDAQLAAINQRLDVDLWTRFVVPAGTYPAQTRDIRTIAQPNVLAVRADLDEDAIYKIIRTIYENLPFLVSIHKATAEMSLASAVEGLPMPLHPGAARYYREAGVAVPERLMPPK
jgi:hypothetical protein